MKQETLEEAAEKLFGSLEKGIGADRRLIWMNGAKWQAERMYSEEEVLDILDRFLLSMVKDEKTGLIEKWFEQFKKK